MTRSALELLNFSGFRMQSRCKIEVGFFETKFNLTRMAKLWFTFVIADFSHQQDSKHTSCPFMAIDYLRLFPKRKFIINALLTA